ncbi:MAG TPA: endonuclease III [Candidatus Polarisedimenticolia bacterium]|nr:endonuclease III [Candidatus Polarisedimenticolia bacterium]
MTRGGARPGPTARAAATLEIIEALERAYGRPQAGPRKDPLSELIFTILSQHTSDLNRDRAWASLWHRFDAWDRIATAPRHSVEAAIRVGGLARTKSRVIQQVLRQVRREEGGYRLESLRGAPMHEVEARLRRFKGVGIKTIRCVQVFSLGQPAFPVDTHIHRITRRIGLVPQKASAETAHRIMQDLCPPGEVLPFHMNPIAHGRRVCKAARPLCEGCVLRALCRHGLRAGRSSRRLRA